MQRADNSLYGQGGRRFKSCRRVQFFCRSIFIFHFTDRFPLTPSLHVEHRCGGEQVAVRAFPDLAAAFGKPEPASDPHPLKVSDRGFWGTPPLRKGGWVWPIDCMRFAVIRLGARRDGQAGQHILARLDRCQDRARLCRLRPFPVAVDRPLAVPTHPAIDTSFPTRLLPDLGSS